MQKDSQKKIKIQKKKKKATKAKSQKKNGRPNKIPDSDAVYTAITYLAAEGKTNAQIAEILGVAETTIYQYKKKSEKFSKALSDGKAIADDLVEQALFARAVGFWGDEVVTASFKGEITDIQTIKKWYPPDPTCLKMWLINRRPDTWRDKKESEVTVNNLHEALSKVLDSDD